ncbi:hypothetical protein [Chitinophaga rhizophila]|uniref:GGDEF domain-containing protein n=1 Tax=Chitinophaga rhizophila TaxID=2866212 RepID=A0ABS7G6W7_9BACT|nr:hypothetical protein [Chitinophaga rhizophila]MBW8683395.1 hypothetical protein [Chitinophaga rhizophila]
MMIPNNILYLGFKSTLLEAERKTIYQERIFTYGLSLTLLVLNLAEMVSSREDRYWLRMTKSLMTIIFTYAAGAVVFLVMNTQEYNMYLYARDIPAGMFCCVTLAMTAGLLLLLQLVSRRLRARTDAAFVQEYFPSWLRFDS